MLIVALRELIIFLNELWEIKEEEEEEEEEEETTSE